MSDSTKGQLSTHSLFAIAMDKLTVDIRKEATWDMLFADDIVLAREGQRELEEDLEIWRNALEKRGLKVSRSKTEYLKTGGVGDGEELKLQGETVKRVNFFKYLGSVVSSDGSCKEEVKRRIQAYNQGGWVGGRCQEFCVTGSCQPGLKAKCSRVSLGQPCYMGWKQWQ